MQMYLQVYGCTHVRLIHSAYRLHRTNCYSKTTAIWQGTIRKPKYIVVNEIKRLYTNVYTASVNANVGNFHPSNSRFAFLTVKLCLICLKSKPREKYFRDKK